MSTDAGTANRTGAGAMSDHGLRFRFGGPWGSSGVTWGAATEGASSVSTWDYVRFGVVPEPAAGLLLGLAGLAGSTRRVQA